MLFPVRRFYAEWSALARDLRTRLSIFTALIPRCTRGPPIFSTSSLMGTLMTFGITPARSSSVHVWQSYFRPAWAIRCNCSRPTGSTGGSLLHRSGASMIIYKLRNPNRAPALASRFETLFQHNASSWQEREESTLQLFLTLRMSVAITVSLIILLAGFGIFNVLTMSVLAKIKEIAILRSMGYRRIDIGAIFLWQGAMIAVAGSVVGCLLGALMTWGVSHIPIRIRGLLYADHFLVTWEWRHYFWATLLAIIAVFIASYVPARRAAELPPVVTLRGSSV